jgi:tyrosine-protein kinase Etk/Wzc
MTTPGEPHPLTAVVRTPPIVSVPFDPRAVGGPAEEPVFDLKGYLHTL